MTPSDRTVVIADDHPLYRRGLADALKADGTYELLAEATDGEKALHLIRQHRPRFAILDVNMPKATGLAVAAELRRTNVETNVVILTMFDDPSTLEQALALDVKGYVLKDSAIADIINCLNLVSAGKRYFSPGISEHLVNRKSTGDSDDAGLAGLSPAERRILKLLADELSTRSIAETLGISARTVEHHRAHICTKLGLRGTNALLVYAVKNRERLA